MAFGFEAWNSSGSVQVDDTFANLALREKRTLTLLNNANPGGRSYVETSYTSADPVVLAIYADQTCSVMQIRRSGNTWTWTLVSSAVAGSTVEVYFFSRPETLPMTGWGQVIWDASSRVVFDARQKYMRVLDMAAGSHWPTDINAGRTWSFPGRKIAFVQSFWAGSKARGYEYVSGNEVESWILQELCGAYSPTPGNLRLGAATWIAWFGTAPLEGEYDYFRGDYSFLLVDVTGY